MAIITSGFVCSVLRKKLSTEEETALKLAFIPAAEGPVVRYLGYNPQRRTISNDEGEGMFSGDGSQYLQLKRKPVYSITNIYEDSAAYFGKGTSGTPWEASTLLTEGTDYVLEPDAVDASNVSISLSGLVSRVGGMRFDASPAGGNIGTYPRVAGNPRTSRNQLVGWLRGVGNIRADYVAGWLNADMPGEIKLATAMVAIRKFNNPGSQNVKSVKLGEYAVQFSDAGGKDPDQELTAEERNLLDPWKDAVTLVY